MSREQTVRDVAFAIWLAEGKPNGRDVEHWKQAESRVASSEAGIVVKPDAGKSAKGKAAAGSTETKGKKPLVDGGAVPSKSSSAKSPAAKSATAKGAPKKKA